jgi:hypothetical protein
MVDDVCFHGFLGLNITADVGGTVVDERKCGTDHEKHS